MTPEKVEPDEPGSGPIRINGPNLSLARRAAGWSQNQLAAKVGVSAGHLSKVIRGEARVSMEVFTALLDAFPPEITWRDFYTPPEPSDRAPLDAMQGDVLDGPTGDRIRDATGQ
jgi:transcriptional regulator with XRE-family HTH domain